jgi:hypothetical protein
MNQCSRMLIPLEELARLSAVHDELLRGIKKGPYKGAFVTARRGGFKKPVRNLRGFVVEFLLIIFFVDLNRDLPSSELPR